MAIKAIPKWLILPILIIFGGSLGSIYGIAQPKPFIPFQQSLPPLHHTEVITPANADQLTLLAQINIPYWTNGLQFSQDSNLMIVTEGSGPIIWDIRAGGDLKYIRLLSLCDYVQYGTCSTLLIGYQFITALSPNNKYLATAYQRYNKYSYAIYDPKTSNHIKDFFYLGLITSLAFSPDSEWLIYLNLARSPECSGLCAYHLLTDRHLSISPYGRWIGFSESPPAVIYQDYQELYTWDLQTHQSQWLFAFPSPDTPFALNADNSLIAFSDGVSIQVVSFVSGTTLATLQHPTPPYQDLVFSPDSHFLAVVDRKSQQLYLYNLQTGIGQLIGEGVKSGSVAFSPNSQLMASVIDNEIEIDDDEIIVWEVATGQPLTSLPAAFHDYQHVFSPDGTLLAADGGTIWGLPPSPKNQ